MNPVGIKKGGRPSQCAAADVDIKSLVLGVVNRIPFSSRLATACQVPLAKKSRPVPRGLEQKIAEKLAYLKRLDNDASAKKK